jgi:hypothetical protein
MLGKAVELTLHVEYLLSEMCCRWSDSSGIDWPMTHSYLPIGGPTREEGVANSCFKPTSRGALPERSQPGTGMALE